MANYERWRLLVAGGGDQRWILEEFSSNNGQRRTAATMARSGQRRSPTTVARHGGGSQRSGRGKNE
ncbi:hypothetical protein CsSME_00032812 [Camellia sinensis var. sinensis]